MSWEQSCYRTLIGVIDGGSIRVCSLTLSDLERPDAKNQFFFRRFLITLVRSATSLHFDRIRGGRGDALYKSTVDIDIDIDICTYASRGLSAIGEFLVGFMCIL